MTVLNIKTLIYSNIKCRVFFNDDLDNGVEVTLDGKYCGKMLGVTVPCTDDDIENESYDKETLESFEYEVETWLMENNY